ncbi:MAG: hypothetical protein NVS3B1_20480 [Marmoricola sp.]
MRKALPELLVIAAETYTQLMTNPPHLEFELTLEALTGILLYPIGRRLLRRAKARWHREIDEEHGIDHDSGLGILSPREPGHDGVPFGQIKVYHGDDVIRVYLWHDGTLTWELQ